VLFCSSLSQNVKTYVNPNSIRLLRNLADAICGMLGFTHRVPILFLERELDPFCLFFRACVVLAPLLHYTEL
jgi:hypothetical protein